jgi:hypothetical protein
MFPRVLLFQSSRFLSLASIAATLEALPQSQHLTLL